MAAVAELGSLGGVPVANASVKRDMEFLKRHSLGMGLVLMFVLTWPIDLATAAEARGWLPFHVPAGLVLSVGYGFVAAALVMTGLTLGRDAVLNLLRQFLVWRVGLRWYGVVLFVYPAVALAAIGLNALWSGTTPDFSRVTAHVIFDPSANLWVFAAGFFLFNVFVNGEEIGWRGYALPRLQARYSAFVSSLILGVIWAVWHVPKYLAPGNSDSFALFFFTMLARAILFTWVYNNTNGSLLMVTLFHAAGNTGYVCLPIGSAAIDGGRTLAIAAVVECVVALVVLRKAGSMRLSRLSSIPVQA